jgi:hypothetical protein
MPTYIFKNEKTGEVWEDILTMSEREEFLKKNPKVIQLPPSSVNLVSGVHGVTHRNDDGWKENIARITEAHPSSALAKREGRRSIAEIKNSAILEKHNFGKQSKSMPDNF